MKTSKPASVRWARILQEQRSSRLSIVEFCRRHKVSQPSFFAWRRRLGVAGGAGEPAPAFVEVRTGRSEAGVPAADAGALELILPGGPFRGRVLVRRGFDRGLLRELMAALEESA